MNQHPLVIFDGVCNLCCGWVQFLLRIDKKQVLRFSSLQSAAAHNVLDAIGIAAEEVDTIILIRGKQYLTGSNAIFEILENIGGIWRLSGIFRVVPRSLRDFIYRLIARSRYNLFGKRPECLIPTPELRKRFFM
ncbi:MAG TPA: thiol-disulfide oxidoreductase DCC family protein [Paludibacter sp.]|nr:thiol-disulfide oxidoreductase DCC family protein [Paludibacter sp.]